MKNIFVYVMLACTVLMGSCKIQEEINFKKDLSGTFNYSVDLGMMRMMATQFKNMKPEKDDKEGKDSIPEPDVNPNDMFKALDSLDNGSLGQRFQKIQGVSNVRASSKDGVISFSMDFKDLDALNRAYSLINSGNNLMLPEKKGFKTGDIPEEMPKEPEIRNFSYFTQKGSYVIFSRPKGKDEASKNGMDASMKQMGETMFEYKSKITFDKKVKSVKAKDITATQEDNAVIIKGGLKELMQNASEIKIKLR